MDRLPIYQTRSTRCLYPRRRPRQRVAMWLAGVVALLLLAIGLGHGFVALARGDATTPGAAAPANATRHNTAEQLREAVGRSPAATQPVATSLPAPAAQIVDTGGVGLLLRPTPGTDQPPLDVLPEGAVVALVGPEQASAGQLWRMVRDEQGREGWVAAGYLQQLPAEG
jgi:hypothetical protein